MLPLLRFLIAPCASCLDHGQQDRLRTRELQLAGSETGSLRSPWLAEQKLQASAGPKEWDGCRSSCCSQMCTASESFPSLRPRRARSFWYKRVILKQRHNGLRISGQDGARKHTHCFLSSLTAGLLRTFDMVQMLRGSHCPRTASTFEVGTQLSVHPWVPLPPLHIVGTWLAP